MVWIGIIECDSLFEPTRGRSDLISSVGFEEFSRKVGAWMRLMDFSNLSRLGDIESTSRNFAWSSSCASLVIWLRWPFSKGHFTFLLFAQWVKSFIFQTWKNKEFCRVSFVKGVVYSRILIGVKTNIRFPKPRDHSKEPSFDFLLTQGMGHHRNTWFRVWIATIEKNFSSKLHCEMHQPKQCVDDPS